MSRSKYTSIEKLEIIQEIMDQKETVNSASRRYSVDSTTIRTWQAKFKRGGISELSEAKHNNHYSKSFKLEVVTAYLNGEGTLQELAIKFGLRNKTQIRNWLSLYNRDKTLTASPFRKKIPNMRRKTTLEERIKIVEYVTVGKHKYSETAKHFEVSYQQARLWVLKAKENGYEALVDNRGHRKHERELSELDIANLKIKQLEAELEEKNAMEVFIKKFQELQHKG